MKAIHFKTFRACFQPEEAQRFAKGHIKVLEDYGIANVTSNNNYWINDPNVVGVMAEDENGEVLGGIRIHITDGNFPLPVEAAVGHLDPKVGQLIRKYLPQGVGELCALWNAKSVAGIGLSLLLTRAGISMVTKFKVHILMGICAGYTLPMFRKVGFVVDESLGDKGKFVYPNESYQAQVLGILNAENLLTAQDQDRIRMLDLRNRPIQTFEENERKGKILIDYNLTLPEIDRKDYQNSTFWQNKV